MDKTKERTISLETLPEYIQETGKLVINLGVRVDKYIKTYSFGKELLNIVDLTNNQNMSSQSIEKYRKLIKDQSTADFDVACSEIKTILGFSVKLHESMTKIDAYMGRIQEKNS